jgi:neuroligin
MRSLFVVAVVVLQLFLLGSYISEAAEATRLVFTKQGPVRGRRFNVRPDLGLGKVDAFFGLPYASSPTGQFRFMPPMSPQSWSPRVREAVEHPPVCPQVIPDLSDKNKALRYMTVGRFNYLNKLFIHLKDQSEDCLYLNIYTPTSSAFGK